MGFPASYSDHRDYAYNGIAWTEYLNKLYACIQLSDGALFIQSERSRGLCDFVKVKSRPGKTHISNETYMCNRAKEGHLDRKEKQQP
jgi:hypothetical protein